MDIRHTIFQVLSSGSGTVGTTPVRIPASADPDRLALQINSCAASGSPVELYVGYSASVGPTNHIARLFAGGPPVEIAARAPVAIWIAGSESGVPYAFAEVA